MGMPATSGGNGGSGAGGGDLPGQATGRLASRQGSYSSRSGTRQSLLACSRDLNELSHLGGARIGEGGGS